MPSIEVRRCRRALDGGTESYPHGLESQLGEPLLQEVQRCLGGIAWVGFLGGRGGRALGAVDEDLEVLDALLKLFLFVERLNILCVPRRTTNAYQAPQVRSSQAHTSNISIQLATHSNIS